MVTPARMASGNRRRVDLRRRITRNAAGPPATATAGSCNCRGTPFFAWRITAVEDHQPNPADERRSPTRLPAAGVARRIAKPLGLDGEAAARGILSIADHTMTGAIRIVSVEPGCDPCDLVLVPFGAAGPLHGGSRARLMEIGPILGPPAPSVLSALGCWFRTCGRGSPAPACSGPVRWIWRNG